MSVDRYARQIVLPQVGSTGQDRLQRSSVLVIGAGGLGCAVMQYLGAAGVGRLIAMDHDQVEETNLHRQPLYRMSDLGRPKAEAARCALLALNPGLQMTAVTQRLTPANAATWIAHADVVVDAADSFAVTYILSDECRRAHKYLISASVLGLSGYAGVFCGDVPSYRAVFPDLPHRAGSCAEAGVLGTTVGVLGTLQAHLTLAVQLRLSPSVCGQLVTVDLATLRFAKFSFTGTDEPDATGVQFIDLSQAGAGDFLIDLRGSAEAPLARPDALRASVEELERDAQAQGGSALPHDERIVLCCRSGLRAWRAARALQQRGYTKLALVALGS